MAGYQLSMAGIGPVACREAEIGDSDVGQLGR